MRSIFFLLLSLGVALLISACSTVNSSKNLNQTRSQAPSRPSMTTDSADITARPGTELTVNIPNYEKMSGKATVDDKGFVDLPLIDELHVQGLNRSQIRQKLKKRYANFIEGDFRLNVQMQHSQTRQITVLGNVNRPSNYDVDRKTTLFKVLSSAGGASPNADLSNIKIFHDAPNDKVERVDLTSYLKSKEPRRSMVMVEPGDIVYVPRQENFVQEMSGMMRSVVVLFGFFRLFN